MKRDNALIRKWRVAKKIRGTNARPRLSVAITLNHIYAQIIDDNQGVTLASASTFSRELARSLNSKDNKQAAKAVGELIAKKAVEKGVTEVVFDRGARRYHGRMRTLAEAAKEGGIKF